MSDPGAYWCTDAYITFTQDIPRPDVTTVGGFALEETTQVHAQPSARRDGGLVWYVVALVWGAVLMALGICLNGPVSTLIYEGLTR